MEKEGRERGKKMIKETKSVLRMLECNQFPSAAQIKEHSLACSIKGKGRLRSLPGYSASQPGCSYRSFLQAGNGLEGSPGACRMSLWVLSFQMGRGRGVILALARSGILGAGAGRDRVVVLWE